MFGVGTVPQQYYVGLTGSEPRGFDDGTSVRALEPSGANYGRQLYNVGPSWWAVNGTTVSNSAAVQFAVPSVPWGYLTHFILCSAANFGDLFAWGVLQNPQVIVQSVAPRLPIGAMVMAMQVSS